MKQIEVQIMGQGYVLGCPEGGETRLGQAVAKAGFVEMCHADTVNANAQAGCRLLAKPQALYVLKSAFGDDGQYIKLSLMVGFDVVQTFAQIGFARGLGNQTELIHQELELCRSQRRVCFGIEHQTVGVGVVFRLFGGELCTRLFGEPFDLIT